MFATPGVIVFLGPLGQSLEADICVLRHAYPHFYLLSTICHLSTIYLCIYIAVICHLAIIYLSSIYVSSMYISSVIYHLPIIYLSSICHPSSVCLPIICGSVIKPPVHTANHSRLVPAPPFLICICFLWRCGCLHISCVTYLPHPSIRTRTFQNR